MKYSLAFCALALAAAAAAAETPNWGIQISRDDGGHLIVLLENSRLRVRYAWKHLEQDETFIRELVDKTAPLENHAGDRIDAGANRIDLKDARIVRSDATVQTVRLEWGPLGKRTTPGIQEVSIFPDRAELRIDYIMWPVNIVDIGTPGGAKTGAYAILGADKWKREQLIYPKVYFCRDPKDVGYESITEVDQPGPLEFNGWFILGVVNPANGHGFGRVVPVESIDIVKLLWNKGFELFPYSRRPKKPFTSYLFTVTGGPAEVITIGKRLASIPSN